MIDLKLNNSFDLVIDNTNDLDVVEGPEEVRQRLIMGLAVYQQRIIGDLNSPNATRKVRQKISQSLADFPSVDSVETIEVEKLDSDTIQVYISYNDGTIINEEV